MSTKLLWKNGEILRAVSFIDKKNKKYNKLKSSNYENIRLYSFRRIGSK